jgi:hypothetical protein
VALTRDWGDIALVALLALYGAGLAIFPPPVALVSDEAQYIRQAVLYSQGHRFDQVRDARTGELHQQLASTYPPGTSLLQAPFVRIGGWGAAAWASYAALCALTLFTAMWLRREGLPTSYAALVPLFLPCSVLARTGMGDLPSAATVVGSLFFLGLSVPGGAVAGGFLAGASLLFRDSNPVFILPWIARRLMTRSQLGPLFLAGASGVALRLLIAWRLQGQPLLIHGPPYPFTLQDAGERALLYAFALLVLVPGGLVALGMHRGRFRNEFVATVGLSFVFFSLYSYSGTDSGLLRALVLGPRYLIPLVPLLAVAAAEVVQRTVTTRSRQRGIELVILIAAAIVTCAVHPALHALAEGQARLVRSLYAATSPEAVLVTEPGATAKYLNRLYGPRTLIDKLEVPPEQLESLLRRGPVQLVFVDRDDSPYWRMMAGSNAQYQAEVQKYCALHLREELTGDERLRVLDVIRCQ